MNAYKAAVVFTGRLLKRKSVGLLLLGGLLVLTQSSGNAQLPPPMRCRSQLSPPAIPGWERRFGDPADNFAKDNRFQSECWKRNPIRLRRPRCVPVHRNDFRGPSGSDGLDVPRQRHQCLGKKVGAIQALDQETSPCWTGGPNDVFSIAAFRFDVLRFLHCRRRRSTTAGALSTMPTTRPPLCSTTRSFRSR